MISEVKENNEHIFVDKVQDIKEKEELAVQIQSLEATITPASNLVLKLHIPEDATTSAKIWKLATKVWQYKEEVGQVNFDFQMKISEL